MAKIAKSELPQAFEQAARTIVSSRLGAEKMSRAALKKALSSGKVPKKQRALVDAFLKLVESDVNLDAEVTAHDVGRALERARERLMQEYQLDDNKLTKDEVVLLAAVGKRAVDLAKALRADAAAET